MNASYRIEWSANARHFMSKLRDEKLSDRITKAIHALASDPRPYNCKRLQGVLHRYLCVRVSDYRIVYEVIDNQLVILVVKIDDRREVYR